MDSWNPGPIDPSVLNDQLNHVSEEVYHGTERGNLLSSQLTEQVYDKWHLTDSQKTLLDKCGFGVFKHEAVVHQTDLGLVSALVERWRPETNTFHLNCGEVTITLEDVHFIFGLPVVGNPLTSPLIDNHLSYFRDCFGSEIASEYEQSKKRGSISLVWLQKQFSNCPERCSKKVVGRYTKAYILWLCGAILFPTRSKNTVHPRYMHFLANLKDCITYSWGAAVLGYLYRALYTATRKGVKYISGCVTLLQVWAYERLIIGRPNPRPQSESWLPRATAWAFSTTHSYPNRRDNPHHHLIFYRGELDIQPTWQVVWRPYSRWDDNLNDNHFEGRLFGSARIPLIHFDIVEYQMPDRVMRQFGFLQGIPSPAENHVDLRKPKEFRFDVENCMALRREYITHWEKYMDHLEGQQEDITNYVSIEQYMQWYGLITRRKIHRQRVEGDQSTTYEPRAVYNQNHLVNMVENAKSIMDKCFAFCQMPPDLRLAKQGWDHHYDIYNFDVRGNKLPEAPVDVTEGSHSQVSQEGGKLHVQESYVPTMQPPIPSLSLEPLGEDVDAFLEEDIEQQQQQHLSHVQSNGQKGWPTKRLPGRKIEFINLNLFGDAIVDASLFPVSHPANWYSLSHNDFYHFRPGLWVFEHVVDHYMSLLRGREEYYRERGIRRWAKFAFMPSFLMHLGIACVPPTQANGAVSFCTAYVKPDIGPPLHECDYIFMPLCNPTNSHFILLIFSVSAWVVILLDPRYDDTKYITIQEMYKQYIDVAVRVLTYIMG